MTELLQSFKDSNSSWGNIEIIIAENGENSVLTELISRFSSTLPITHYFPGVYLLTSEENVFRAWDQCKGKFTWILGDDDPVNFPVLSNLLEILEEGRHNVIKFNSNFIGAGGEKYRYQATPAYGESHTLNFNEFIRRVGMWHTAAGYSTWVFRTNLFDSKSANAWISKFQNPIYSHVTYFISKLHDKELLFVNQNLVNYRISGYVYGDDGWARYAKLTNKQYFFPWTLGFVRQLRALNESGALPLDIVREMIGDHVFSQRFLELDSMISLSIQQCILGLEKQRERFTLYEWEELASFFRQILPEDIEIWGALHSAVVTSWSGTWRQKKKKKSVITRMLSNRANNLVSNPFGRNFKMTSGMYDIYSFSDYFIGIKSTEVFSLGDICVIDFEKIPNNHVIRKSLATLIDELQKFDRTWQPRRIPSNYTSLSWFERNFYTKRIAKVFTTQKQRIIIRKILFRWGNFHR
jgi:hypothetical protein